MRYLYINWRAMAVVITSNLVWLMTSNRMVLNLQNVLFSSNVYYKIRFVDSTGQLSQVVVLMFSTRDNWENKF